MKFDKIKKLIKDLPHTEPSEGKVLYDFILASKIEKILELGFEHGTSTCYMAAALDEMGTGEILTIDREVSKKVQPNIHELLEKTGLGEYVRPIFAQKTYVWELMKLIQRQSENNLCQPIFDFCFIDGAHSWEVDGFAFFLAEKLLKPGGWFLFDDLSWTFASSPNLKNSEFVKSMPKEERITPQIERIFRLLVAQHPNFEIVKMEDKWGWAQKKRDASVSKESSENLVDVIYRQQSIMPDVVNILRKIKRKIL